MFVLVWRPDERLKKGFVLAAGLGFQSSWKQCKVTPVLFQSPLFWMKVKDP